MPYSLSAFPRLWKMYVPSQRLIPVVFPVCRQHRSYRAVVGSNRTAECGYLCAGVGVATEWRTPSPSECVPIVNDPPLRQPA